VVDADTTRISVVLSGDAVSGDAIVHLHDGTCDVAGDYTLDLDPIKDSGISVTDVDLSLDELIGDGYFINVHQSEDSYDTWFVCGELTIATVGMIDPEVAPDTGAGGTLEQTPAAVVPEVAPDTGASGTLDQTPTPVATAVATVAPATPSTSNVTVAGGTGDGTQGAIADAGKGVLIDPAGGTGDGTQGDIADAGKGAPIDPTTGLPITAGTGSSLPWPGSSHGLTPWIMAAMSIVLVMAGIAIRIIGSRPAGARSFARSSR